jgi:hypothetical protein
MTTLLPKLRTDGLKVSDREILLRLAANPEDARSLELLLDRYRWIIEDEVSHCFGRPPWLDSAVAALFVEIVRGAVKYEPQKHKAAQWIRTEARRAGRRLEHRLADEHAKDGFLEFSPAPANLELLVTCLLQQRGSLYWNDLRPHKPLRRPAHGVY